MLRAPKRAAWSAAICPAKISGAKTANSTSTLELCVHCPISPPGAIFCIEIVGSTSASREKGPHRTGPRPFRGKLAEAASSGEGQMSGMRVFVVLSWVVFAVRQILVRPATPVKVLAGRDPRSR
jgi:hypothetical protein